MPTNIKLIKQQFKKSIDKYSENAIVQKITAEKLASTLRGRAFNKVLEIGVGTGFLTEYLMQNISYKHYFTNDLIEKAEEYAAKYIPDTRFYCGDFRRIKFNQSFDLIASNAVFQWFDNLEKIFAHCKNIMNEKGILAFSTFSPQNFKEFHELSGLTLNYKSAEEISRLLEPNFEIIKLETFEYILNFDNPLKILTHMKNTGVNSLSPNPWSIMEIKNFCNKYQKKYPDLQITYSPIIIVAQLK